MYAMGSARKPVQPFHACPQSLDSASFFAEQAHETGLNMWNSAILAYRRAADRRWECA